MAFHEVRFPASLSFGSVGGPERRTEIVTMANGFEERNSPWAHSRRRISSLAARPPGPFPACAVSSAMRKCPPEQGGLKEELLPCAFRFYSPKELRKDCQL